MSAPARAIVAWEPFTPRGVAAFASAGPGRLLLVQFLAALLAAAALVWFVDKGCFPVVGAAVQKLPATGEIRSGRLDWPDHSPELLAGGRLLALDVDLDHSGQIGPAADVQIEFGRETIRSFSLFGYWEWPYPRGYVIREIQRDRSLKVFKLFAESVRQTSQTAAVHPQRVILLFNVACGNPANVRHSRNTTVFSTFTTSAGLYRTAAASLPSGVTA
jgi:hypothetical protein